MLTLDQVRDALKDRRLLVVAQSCGLSYGTLKALRDDLDAKPSYETVIRVAEYLEGTADKNDSED